MTELVSKLNWIESMNQNRQNFFLVACTWLYMSLCRSVCPSVRWSVRRSVRRSVRPSVRPLHMCKNRVSRLFFGHGEILYWIKRNLRASFATLSFICLLVHLSLHICHMFIAKVNTRGDTVRTHRCPVGLVIRSNMFFNAILWKPTDHLTDRQTDRPCYRDANTHLTRPYTRQH